MNRLKARSKQPAAAADMYNATDDGTDRGQFPESPESPNCQSFTNLKNPAELIAALSNHSCKVLGKFAAYSDISVLTSDGYEFCLLKTSLMEHSEVFGSMIEELGSDTNAFSISEDGNSFSQLLEVMYCRLQTAPIATENVESVLELGRKYDVARAHDYCDQFLCQQPLNWKQAAYFSQVYGWALTYELPATLLHCRTYLASSYIFQQLPHGVTDFWTTGFMDKLSLEEQVHVLKTHVQSRQLRIP